MTKSRKYKSDASEAIHSAVTGMRRAGTIEKETMRSFDQACLAALDTSEPQQISRFAKASRSANLYLPAT